jgi:di/tricarboxylate transporter
MTARNPYLPPTTTHTLDVKDWVQIGAAAAALSIAGVLIFQALALALWPAIASFKPLDSFPRSALFTLIPAIAATFIFAQITRRSPRPVAVFLPIAALVLLVSLIPDYAIPDPNKTLLASSVAGFLHAVAGLLTTGVLVAGYQYRLGRHAGALRPM